SSVATRALSSPRSSVFGQRPTASRRWLPTISGAPLSHSRLTAMSLPRFATRRQRALRRTSMPSRLRNIGDGGGGIRVLPRNEARRQFDDGDIATEAAIDLREFETDVTAADHDQVRRQGIEREDRAVGEIVDLVEARDIRDERPTSDIDEYPLGLQYFVCDRN